MRLQEVRIAEFKNLKNLQVSFDPESPYTVLVGENGSGKSNFIEALSLAFRNLDLDEEAPFSYELKYQCRGNVVHVSAARGQTPSFRVKDGSDAEFSELTRRRFMAEDDHGRPMYRPAFVFGYYSGPSDRLSSIYERHRERYYSWIIKAPSQRRKDGPVDPNALRRLFYSQTLHGQFALLAFFMEPERHPNDDRSFLREHLQIDGLDSVLFALRKPPWTRSGGDARFWQAEGEVRQFLHRLHGAAMPPLRMQRRMAMDLTKNPSVDNLYLFLPDATALEKVYRSYRDQYAFFTALESTHLSRLLAEVRTRVRMTPESGGRQMTYRELSEGEQQLLLVLGLLKFTARDEALFLLDEPDTHLNPAWSTQYLGYLDRFIRDRETCHIIMSSHDPLVFAGLERRQLKIFRRAADGFASVEIPDRDPKGMGVAAILTSDLFRLRSTLDSATQSDLDRQRTLAMKELLSADELTELRLLKKRLRLLGFTQSTRDPLYGLFVDAWTKAEDPQWSDEVQLTPEQIHEREALAAQIVASLKEQEH